MLKGSRPLVPLHFLYLLCIHTSRRIRKGLCRVKRGIVVDGSYTGVGSIWDNDAVACID